MLTDWDAGAILRRAYDRASEPPEGTNWSGYGLMAGGVVLGAAGILGAPETGGASLLDEGEAGTLLSEGIASTFANGEYTASTLSEDMTAFRFSGGVSQPVGSFLTTGETVSGISSPVSASMQLALPEGATADTLNTFTIPAGTQIFTGGISGGAEGATQIYIQNPSVLIPK